MFENRPVPPHPLHSATSVESALLQKTAIKGSIGATTRDTIRVL